MKNHRIRVMAWVMALLMCLSAWHFTARAEEQEKQPETAVTDGSSEKVSDRTALTDGEQLAEEDPETPTAYKMYMSQALANEPGIYYFDGGTSGDRYLTADTSLENAVDVFFEEAEGGVHIYFFDNEVKKYIDVLFNSSGKLAVQLTETPTALYTYAEAFDTYIAQLQDKQYFVGSYKTFTTFSVSQISYLTEANCDISQFPAHFIPSDNTEPPVIPDAAKVAAEKEALSLSKTQFSAVDETVELPLSGATYEEVTIAWAIEANEYAVIGDGNLLITALPAEDVQLTLTATLTCGEASVTRQFVLTVLSHVLTATEIMDLLYALESGQSLEGTYTLTGTITAIDTAYSTQYGNISVTIRVDDDDQQRTVLCFRLVGGEELKVKDIIKVTGKLKNYQGKREFDAGCTYEMVQAYEITPEDKIAAEKEELALEKVLFEAVGDTLTLPANGTTYEEVAITWAVAENDYAAIEDGNLMITALPAEDAEIVLTATLTCGDASDTKEFTITVLSHELTVTEIMDMLYALEAGQSLTGTYTLTGTVTEINTAYNSHYGNITVTIRIDEDELQRTVQCYRLTGGEELKVNDIIAVTGTLKNFKGTVEFDSGCTYVMVQAYEFTDPVIVAQPESVSVKAGSNVTLSVEVEGIVLQYQWQYRADASEDWTDVTEESGKTASYTFKAALSQNGYQFRCAITGESGDILYSEEAVLTVTSAAGWHKNASGWWYQREDGTYPANQWEKIGGKWYHFDAKGYMQTGWLTLGSKTYYLGTSGAMKTGWAQVDGNWYYLNASGVMQTGWTEVDGKWYYLDASGVMQTGWLILGTKRYYLNASGVMKTGWLQLDGNWYYLNASGVMQTGWKTIGDKWYYFTSDGVMLTGWQTISGKTYYFKSSGAMAASEWCNGWWLNANGTWTYQYKASWKQNTKGWWFGDESGWYAKNCTITIDGKSYTFDASGYLQ